MARVARPTFSIASGVFETKQNSIQANCATSGAYMRYKLIYPSTTDLSPPTSSVGTLVANGGFIAVTAGAIAILVIAYKSGMEDSYISALVRVNAKESFLATGTYNPGSGTTQRINLIGPLDASNWDADTAYTEYPGIAAPILATREGQALMMGQALFWYAVPHPHRKRTNGSEFDGSALPIGTQYPAWFKNNEVYLVRNGNEVWKNQGVPVSGYSSLVGVAPMTVNVGGHNGTRFVVGGDNGINAAMAYSDDNCATFTFVSLSVSGTVKALAINFATNKFMAITSNGECFTSTDGAAWTPGGMVVASPSSVEILYHVTGAIWLAQVNGPTVYRSTDDGATWSLVKSSILSLGVVNFASTRLCVTCSAPSGSNNPMISESTDDGATWSSDKPLMSNSGVSYHHIKPVLKQWPESTVLADPIIEIDAGDPSKVRIYPSDVFALTHYTLDGTAPDATIGDAVLWGQEITVPDGAYFKVISTRSGYTSSAVVEYDRTSPAVTTKICGYVQPAGSSSHVLLINKTTRQVIEEVVPNPTTGYYEFLNYSADNIQNYSVIPLSGEVGLKVITGMDNVTPEIIE